jgi:hypothetical protein
MRATHSFAGVFLARFPYRERFCFDPASKAACSPWLLENREVSVEEYEEYVNGSCK